MLYFAVSLVAGVSAVLLAQMADIECVNAPRATGTKRVPAFFKQVKREVRSGRVRLSQLVQQ